MTLFAKPEPLFNPVTAPADQLLTGWEVLAGPYGLLAFLPLIPILLQAARRWPRGALITSGLVWLFATTGPITPLVLAGGCLVACAWVVMLSRLLAAGRIGARGMIALVWLGAAALVVPLWWYPRWSWYGWGDVSRMALLHNVGVAYFFLRIVAWGVDLSKNPRVPLRAIDTVCWLLYPPCMRLGPVLLRDEFLERLDVWNPSAPVSWRPVRQRLGLFVLGLLGLGIVGALIAMGEKSLVPAEGPDFFTEPRQYSTAALLRVFYLVPIQVYLLLWTYNELAAALSLWVGIRIDNNFDWLPRATSVRDFWRRWHVTVGAWLRNYIYIPLGGNRGIVLLNYCAVFGFCGLWHGASWSFLGWGASQALALAAQRWWDQLRSRWGWSDRPNGRWWTGLCWLATMHYQIATIIVFVDFEHLGWRLFRELWWRLVTGASPA